MTITNEISLSNRSEKFVPAFDENKKFISLEEVQKYLKNFKTYQLCFQGSRTLIFQCQGEFITESLMKITKTTKCASKIFIGYSKNDDNFFHKKSTEHTCQMFLGNVKKKRRSKKMTSESQAEGEKQKSNALHNLPYKFENSVAEVYKKNSNNLSYSQVYDKILLEVRKNFKVDGVLVLKNLNEEEANAVHKEAINPYLSHAEHNDTPKEFYKIGILKDDRLVADTSMLSVDTEVPNFENVGLSINHPMPHAIKPETAPVKDALKEILEGVEINYAHDSGIDFYISMKHLRVVLTRLCNQFTLCYSFCILPDLFSNIVFDLNRIFNKQLPVSLQTPEIYTSYYAHKFADSVFMFFDYPINLVNSRPVVRLELVSSADKYSYLHCYINYNGKERRIAVCSIEKTSPGYAESFLKFVEKNIYLKMQSIANNCVLNVFSLIVIVDYDVELLNIITQLSFDFFVLTNSLAKQCESLNIPFAEYNNLYNEFYTLKDSASLNNNSILKKYKAELVYINKLPNKIQIDIKNNKQQKLLDIKNISFYRFVEDYNLSQSEAFVVDSYNYCLRKENKKKKAEIFEQAIKNYEKLNSQKNKKVLNINAGHEETKYLNTNCIRTLILSLKGDLEKLKDDLLPTLYSYYSSLLNKKVGPFGVNIKPVPSQIGSFDDAMHNNLSFDSQVQSFVSEDSRASLKYFEFQRDERLFGLEDIEYNYKCSCNKVVYESTRVNEKIFVCEHVLIYAKFKGKSLGNLIDVNFTV